MDLNEAIHGLIKKCSTEQPSRIRFLLEEAQKSEGGVAARILEDILENSSIAAEKSVPMCQDTGALTFFVRKGDFSEKELESAITKAVDRATGEAILRPNSVGPASGKNLGNLPEIHFEDGEFEVRLLLKGGGSENVSTQYKLPDASLGAGRDLEGAAKCVVDAVFRAQGRGCPPYFVGVCIGGQRESSYLEAKKQLFRNPGERSGDLGDFECSVKERINSLGIGPMGLGGKTTAFDVFAATLPRHPASYFVSVSLNCWALRRYSLTIKDGKPNYS